MAEEDKNVDVDVTDKADNATIAENQTKKDKISAHKKAVGALKRLGKKAIKGGEEFIKEHGAKAAMALALGGGVNDASAQRIGELHISSDGTQTLNGQVVGRQGEGMRVTADSNGKLHFYTETTSSGRTADFQTVRAQGSRGVQQSSPGQQANAKLQALATYLRTNGMVIDEELSYGLRQEYLMKSDGTRMEPVACAAYHPGNRDVVYFFPTNFYGKACFSGPRGNCETWQSNPAKWKHIVGNPYLGGGYGAPSAFLDYFASQGVAIDYNVGMEAGYGPGGYGVYGGDEWDRKIDEVNHAVDQVGRAIGTAARIGATVGDVLHIGNEIGGYIKREAKRGMGKAPSGVHRSGGRGGRR